jgi:uncharacterized protein involved in exopolysaccharide biosynthesis
MSLQGNNDRNGHSETDMFDVGGVFRFFSEAVRHHLFLVFFTCAATLAVVVWYHAVWPPVYTATAQLVAERDLDPSRDQFYASWQVFRKEDPRNEIALFTAGPVLRDVIAKQNLTYDDVYHPFMSHVGYLWEKSWLGTRYTSFKNSLLGEPDVPQSVKDAGRVMEGLKASIDLTLEGDSNVANVSVKGPTARVHEITNTLVNSYLAHRKERQTREARTAFEVLTEEARKAEVELAAVRDGREVFSMENGLLMDFQKETQDVRELTGLETNMASNRSKIAALEASLNEVNTRLQTQAPEQVLASVREVNSVREAARLKRLELQSSLLAMQGKYRDDSPEIRDLKADIGRLDEVIAREPEQVQRSVTSGVNTVYQQLMASRVTLMSDLEGARSALANEQQTRQQMLDRLTLLPEMTGKALDLQRAYDLAKEKYQRLLFRRMEAEVSASSAAAVAASVQVVDYAVPPTGKAWPRLKYLYPGALLVGLGLGVITAVLRTLTSGRLMRSHMDTGRIAAPVYATVGTDRRSRFLTVVSRQSGSIEPPPRDADENEGRSNRSRGAGS